MKNRGDYAAAIRRNPWAVVTCETCGHEVDQPDEYGCAVCEAFAKVMAAERASGQATVGQLREAAGRYEQVLVPVLLKEGARILLAVDPDEVTGELDNHDGEDAAPWSIEQADAILVLGVREG